MNLRLSASLVGVAASTLLLAAPASAGQSYDPNVTRIANPANVCKSIPGSIQYFAAMTQQTIDTSGFDYGGCVTTLARGEAFVEPAEEFGSPYVQCDMLQEFGVTYPYVFHNGDSLEDMVLPDLKANNRKQCGSALYAFHSIFTAIVPYLPPELLE
jgi:hypothetical protein